MSNFYYAQLDNNNIVHSVTQLLDEVKAPNLVPINSFDLTLIGQQYNPTTGQFSPVTPTLDQAKQNKIAELNTDYQESFTTFQSSALGSVHTYPIDQEAQDNLDKYVQLAAANPNKNTFYFKTLEQGLMVHTRAQFLQLVDDAEAFEVSQVKKFEAKEAQVNACNTVDQVNSIVWNDTTPPNAPTGLQGTAGTGQVTLTWTENSEIDVQIGGGYNVYQGSTKVNTSPITGTSYTVTGLTSGTSYTFTITAVDSDGNESAHSASVTVTAN
jgi:hypothetical protein